MMDGTTAGNGPGPRIMEPVRKDVLLASADQVAIDAVAAKLMGFDPLSIPYIRLAHEAGLGVGRPDEIEIVGDEAAAAESWGFKVGPSFHRFAGWVTWFGPTRFLQKLLTRPPLLYLGNFYSLLLPRRHPLAAPGEGASTRSGSSSPNGGRLFQEYRDRKERWAFPGRVNSCPHIRTATSLFSSSPFSPATKRKTPRAERASSPDYRGTFLVPSRLLFRVFPT